MNESAIGLLFTGLYVLNLFQLGLLFKLGDRVAKVELRMDNFEHPEGYTR